MGDVYPAIDDKLAAWIGQQRMFFVATAPLAADGLVNCSPKGLDSFAILDPHTVAYADMTGSGIETVAHLRENGRILLMFCAFEGPPKILRLHGVGRAVTPDDPEFARLIERFPDLPGVRAVIRVDVQRIADSCGFGVPKYAYEGPRDTLVKYAAEAGPEKLAAYRAEKNRTSLDGLPGLPIEAT